MGVEDLSGRMFGRYELRQWLGEGGMGAVYRAFDTGSLKREVAVKVLFPKLAAQSDYRERFEREARIAASLEHKHIIPVYEYGTQDSYSYIGMRLLTGGSLEDRLKSGNPLLPLDDVARLLEHLASALNYAHSKQVIHRDVKASNAMLDEEDDVYLGDFGIAKLLDSSADFTQTGMILGTHRYLAPERWQGKEASPATDQYALGILVYALLTGKPAFDGSGKYTLMEEHLHQPPPPVQEWQPGLPDSINPVLEKVLAKDPKARYPTTKAFAEAFREAALPGQTPLKTPPVPVPPPIPPLDDDQKTTTPPVILPPTPQPSPRNDAEKRDKPLAWLRTHKGLSLLVVSLTALAFVLIWSSIIVPPPPPTGTQTAINGTETALAMIAASVSDTSTLRPTVSSTPTDTPTATGTATPTATTTPSPTPRPTFTPSHTPMPTPTLSETDFELTIQALMAEAQTDVAQSEATLDAATAMAVTSVARDTALAQTATAEMWTETPTPDARATALARLTMTQDIVIIQATQTQIAVETQFARDLTATATAWTDTPTATRTPTGTPTPSTDTANCDPAPRLTVGGLGRVLGDTPNNIRIEASGIAEEVGQIPAGQIFEVLEGPVCGQILRRPWWLVSYNGVAGWTAEGDNQGYWVEPVSGTPSILLTQQAASWTPMSAASAPTPTSTSHAPLTVVRATEQAITGSLTRDDPSAYHEFTWEAGAVVKLELVSSNFDTFLTLQYPDQSTLSDDDSAGELDSRIGPVVLPANGTYRVIVDTVNSRYGSYTLTITDYSVCGDSPIAIPLQDETRLHSGPGANFAVPRTADSDECLPIIGQTSDGAWLQVRTTVGQTAWVAVNEVVVMGDMENVPEVGE